MSKRSALLIAGLAALLAAPLATTSASAQPVLDDGGRYIVVLRESGGEADAFARRFAGGLDVDQVYRHALKGFAGELSAGQFQTALCFA